MLIRYILGIQLTSPEKTKHVALDYLPLWRQSQNIRTKICSPSSVSFHMFQDVEKCSAPKRFWGHFHFYWTVWEWRGSQEICGERDGAMACSEGARLESNQQRCRQAAASIAIFKTRSNVRIVCVFSCILFRISCFWAAVISWNNTTNYHY